MPNDAVVFSRGLAATMPATYQEGRFLLQTDTGALFLDDTSSSRIQIKDNTKLPLTGGTITGALELTQGTGVIFIENGNIHMTSGGKITNVPEPTSANDAANKQYVDSKVNEGAVQYVDAGVFMINDIGRQPAGIPIFEGHWDANAILYHGNIEMNRHSSDTYNLILTKVPGSSYQWEGYIHDVQLNKDFKIVIDCNTTDGAIAIVSPISISIDDGSLS